MKEINKLSMPATILIASVILGGFYYLGESNKQASIERQQQIELAAEKEVSEARDYKESSDKLSRMFCVDEAKELATTQYEKTCSYDCTDGYYYIASYENYYKVCLQRKGLE